MGEGAKTGAEEEEGKGAREKAREEQKGKNAARRPKTYENKKRNGKKIAFSMGSKDAPRLFRQKKDKGGRTVKFAGF